MMTGEKIQIPKLQKQQSTCSMGSPRFRTGLLGLTGALLIASAAVMIVYFPVVLQYVIEKRLELREDAPIYEIWKEPDIPLYNYIYIFNITNPDEMAAGEKPILEELGPYVYKQKWRKENITFNPNGTVSYQQRKIWYFQRNESVGDDLDKVVSINVPMLHAANMFKYSGLVLRMVLQTVFTMTETNLFIKVRIRDLLFNGYDSAFLKMAKEVVPNLSYPFREFAYLYGKNDSDDGIYTIETGKNGMDRFGKVQMFQGQDNIDYWFSSTCGMINGTNGETYPPNVPIDEPLKFFVPDMCRSVQLTYNKSIVHEGIPGARFEIQPEFFQNATENPDNECFCDGDCLPSGVYNISRCKWDAPVVISLPHFLYGDPRYLSQVQGVSPPDKEKHSLFIDVETQTGAVLRANINIQIGVILERMEGVTQLEKLRNIVLPTLWITQTASLANEMHTLVKLAAVDAHVYSKIGYISMFAIGGLMLVVALMYYVVLTKRYKTKPFTSN